MSSWRRFHDRLAERLRGEPIGFLNYGLQGSGAWMAGPEAAEKYHLNLLRRVLHGIGISGRVLEVGSGRGGNCAYLCQHAASADIYGVDTCAGYLQDCRRAPSLSRVKLLLAEAEALPFRSGAFDLVLNLESAHCYARFDRFLAEVSRVLRPGGIFCCADLWGLPLPDVDWTERRRCLAASGLLVLLEEDLSREVFEALDASDGLPAALTPLRGPSHDPIVEHLQQTTELVRLSLAVGECRYRMWRMQKPGPS